MKTVTFEQALQFCRYFLERYQEKERDLHRRIGYYERDVNNPEFAQMGPEMVDVREGHFKISSRNPEAQKAGAKAEGDPVQAVHRADRSRVSTEGRQRNRGCSRDGRELADRQRAEEASGQ